MSKTEALQKNNESLFDVEQSLMKVFRAIQETPEDQEPSSDLLYILDYYLTKASGKRDRMAAFKRHVKAAKNAAQAEIERLQDRLRSIQSAENRMDNYVLGIMQMQGVKELEGETSTLQAKESEYVDDYDRSEIPPKYWRIVEHPVEYHPDKDSIKRAIKSGEHVPGCRLAKHKKLVVK